MNNIIVKVRKEEENASKYNFCVSIIPLKMVRHRSELGWDYEDSKFQQSLNINRLYNQHHLIDLENMLCLLIASILVIIFKQLIVCYLIRFITYVSKFTSC